MTLRKGWCPTLTRPMQSGDGLLVRINMHTHTLPISHARAIAHLSAQYGNGEIDITSRGNIQIRGVTEASYPPLLAALAAFGIEEAGRPPRAAEPVTLPDLGITSECTITLRLLFGRLTAQALEWLASIAEDYITLGATRTVSVRIAGNPSSPEMNTLIAQAESMGFITCSADPRRYIEACPGAPACSSAQADTRNLALSIAKTLPDLEKSVHVSGCVKGCACARKTDIVITAHNSAYHLTFNGKADAMPVSPALSASEVIRELVCRENV